MTRILWILLGALCLQMSVQAELNLETLQKRQAQMRATVKAALPAVVGIEFPTGGAGSGVIVGETGLILTAAHVSGASGRDVSVILAGGERLPGKTLGAYRSLDAGMIQILAEDRRFPTVPLGDSDRLLHGQWCLALGHPGGFVKGRSAPVRLGRLLSLDENGFLMTDSTLVGGDSGGPLLDLEGRLIGIHSSIGFSLSENRHVPLRAFRDQWETMTDGEVVGKLFDGKHREVGFLGIEIDPQAPQAKVRSVIEKSPASQSGLRVGDLMLKLNGKPLRGGRHFLQSMRRYEPKEVVMIEIKRGENPPIELEVRLAFRSDFIPEK